MSKTSLTLFGGLCISLLLLPLPGPETRMFRVLMDLGHFPLLFLVTGVWIKLRETVRSSIVIIGLLLLQIVFEELQALTGRNPAVQDIVVGTCGVLAALLLFRNHSRLRLFYVSMTLVLPALWFGGNIVDDRAGRTSVPVLSDFVSPFAANRWEVNGLRPRWRSFQWELVLDDESEPYPGFYWEGVPADWSGYSRLVVELEEEGIPGILRLDDRMNPEFHERRHYRLDVNGSLLIADLSADGMVEGHPPAENPEGLQLLRATFFFPEMQKQDRLRIRKILLMP